jgi:hypothetical protein
MPFSDDELVWPEKAPDANRGYAMDLTDELDPGETPTAISVSISPSGATDDLVVGADVSVMPLYVTGNIVTVWLQGGVPGRVYLVRFLIGTNIKAELSLMVSVPITRTLQAFPPPEPTSTAFGAPTHWPS